MTRPLRVLFFTTSMGGGGAESHLLRVINHVDRARVEPVLAVGRRGGSYEPMLRPDVQLHEVGTAVPSSVGRVLSAGPKLLALALRLRPDVVMSVMDLPNLTALAALVPWRRLSRSAPRLVSCVQIPPSIDNPDSFLTRRVVLPGIRRLYPHADRVIALSHGVKKDLEQIAPQLSQSISVIHNACVDERVSASEASQITEPKPGVPLLLAAGRLVYQKGYPFLLDAFRRVRDKRVAQLWILGEGPDRGAMEARIAELKLGEDVRLLGFKDNPMAYMRAADVFVLSSLYEGFGNVIVEAMACGAPVVSTDCPYGPSEIITPDVDGILVPPADANALAEALGRMLDDHALRARIRSAGVRRSADFAAPRVAADYASALEDTVFSSR